MDNTNSSGSSDSERHTSTKKSDIYSIPVSTSPSPQHQDELDLETGIGVGVGLLAVMIAVVVLTVYRHKLPRKLACCAAERSPDQRTNAGHNNTEGNTGNHHYEEINVQKQQESSPQPVYATASPPADMVHDPAEHFQKDGIILPVTSKSGSAPMGQSATKPPADIVHYASVDFHKDGNKLPDADTNISTAMEESAANPLAGETTLYSAVLK